MQSHECVHEYGIATDLVVREILAKALIKARGASARCYFNLSLPNSVFPLFHPLWPQGGNLSLKPFLLNWVFDHSHQAQDRIDVDQLLPPRAFFFHGHCLQDGLLESSFRLREFADSAPALPVRKATRLQKSTLSPYKVGSHPDIGNPPGENHWAVRAASQAQTLPPPQRWKAACKTFRKSAQFVVLTFN